MRAFEAAARHESFVLAADELNVTPGAISQHIKSLESWSGTPLFRRNPQGVELTEAGAALLPDFTMAFDELAGATRALRNLKPHVEFQIAALPSIAQLWLPKRLRRVRAKFPEINFSVTAMETPPSLDRELFDLSIFFGLPENRAEHIHVCDDEIVPVCAPDLVQASDSLETLPLLHDQTWAEDWLTWSQKTGRPLSYPQRGPQFSLYSLAVEEAKAGAGLLMGHLCLIEEPLASGALQVVIDHRCSTGRSLIIEVPHSRRKQANSADIVAILTQ